MFLAERILKILIGVRLLVHSNDLHMLNMYVNHKSLVSIVPNQIFYLVYDIWQLVSMIQWFLFC